MGIIEGGFGLWLILMIVTGALASRRGRSVVGWLLLALILTPVVIVVLLVLPDRSLKTCPDCAEATRRSAASAATSSDLKSLAWSRRAVGFHDESGVVEVPVDV
jgi:hypothetical protein